MGKSEFYFRSGQNVFQLTLQEPQRHLMENLKGFKYPTEAKCDKNDHLTKTSHLRLKMRPWGLYIVSNFCLNGITIPFRLL